MKGGGANGGGEGAEGDGDREVGTVWEGDEVHLPPPLGDIGGIGVCFLPPDQNVSCIGRKKKMSSNGGSVYLEILWMGIYKTIFIQI